MDALLFIAKYGVLLCGILAVLCSASSQVRQLVLSFRHKNKFVQVLIFVWFVSLVVYGGSKPNADTDDSSQNSNQQEHSTQMPAGMVSTNINTQPQFMGGNVANTLNSTSQSQLTLPQWYIAKGYPIDDSDGDGIPDTWERWTHTKKLVNDALLDYDGDEVDNINEFMYMCDPHRRDTDGDGLDDKTEIDGMLAGIDGLNPISKANYIVTEVDSNYNGIPDLWDETSYHSFRDVNNDGFDDVYTNKMPPSSQYNFDVAVTISTTRTALLSSEYGSMLIAPCTNKVVKLRLSGDVDEGSISLSAFPDGANVSGLWKARMDISFLPRYGQDVENNRIKIRDGHFVDFKSMSDYFVGNIVLQQRIRTNSSNSNYKLEFDYTSNYIDITVDLEHICIEHGPAPRVEFYKPENAPLYQISIQDYYIVMTNSYLEINDLDDNLSIIPSSLSIEVREISGKYQKLENVRYFNLELSKICHNFETNYLGACWDINLNDLNPFLHEPSISTNTVSFGVNCPIGTNITMKIGFIHDESILKIRNLERIETDDIKDIETDHCKGVPTDYANIDLYDYLDPKFNFLRDKIYFKVNGKIKNIICPQDCSSEPMIPDIFHVEMYINEIDRPLDRMWVTVYALSDKADFDDWYRSENLRGTNWMTNLPKPYIKKYMISVTNPHWKTPTTLGSKSYLHHNAVYESRSIPIEGGHGHQATYDVSGNLITSGIAAGSADYVSPKSVFDPETEEHRNLDVTPFVQAAQIDGNPVRTTNATDLLPVLIPTRFSRPCLYQGSELNKYFYFRPATPTGIQTNTN